MNKPIETQLRQGIEICAVQNYGEIQEKAPPDRQGSGRGVWRLQDCFLLLLMVDEHHPLFHKYRRGNLHEYCKAYGQTIEV